MLRINPCYDSNHAKSYFTTPDYYLRGDEAQELPGRWRGEGARRLGQSGEVQQESWEALCDNRHPETGQPLTVRRKQDRIVGYDFNFHVPKGVSLLYAMTQDERLLEAFRDSVDGTMHDIEQEMATRVRRRNKQADRITGNMVWGEFIHLTARPIDGHPDPHLHAHCFVHNATFDTEEDRWKAGKFREIKRDGQYFEAVFHSRLAHRLHDLGLPIERSRKGWDLAGIDAKLVEKFSRRTKQIEEKALALGIENPKAKAELGAKTRQGKAKDLSFQELQHLWQGRLTPTEADVLAELAKRTPADAEPVDSGASARAFDYARQHVFTRQSVVPERQLLTVALKQSVGEATCEAVHETVRRSDLITGTRDGRRMVTTRDVLAEETRVVQFARAGRGACRPAVSEVGVVSRPQLNEAQRHAVRHIVQSRDRVILLRGAAGVGKTTLMQEAVEKLESAGHKVYAFAPSSDASRNTLREAGFKNADTVAMLLHDPKLQTQVEGEVIWIDEAGLLDMPTTAQVFELAQKNNCRVLLSGDRYQHGAVGRGAVLRLLEQEAGLVPAEVKEIQRQKGYYKLAVKALSEGRVADGFKGLDRLNWIKEFPLNERYQALAGDYVRAVSDGKTALVVSPTHAEGDRITAEIRERLQVQGRLAREGRSLLVLENAHLTDAERTDAVNYQPGDVLLFHQNGKGFTRGDRVTVQAGQELPLAEARRFEVFHARQAEFAAGDVIRITHNGKTADGAHRLDNGTLYRIREFDAEGNIVLDNGWTVGSSFGHLTHGYVITSHTSQSKTVDRVFVGQSSQSFPASSREQFYVSASRAREQVTVYTDSKADLLDAVAKADERINATEFVNRLPHLQAEALRCRDEALGGERDQPDREVNYER